MTTMLAPVSRRNIVGVGVKVETEKWVLTSGVNGVAVDESAVVTRGHRRASDTSPVFTRSDGGGESIRSSSTYAPRTIQRRVAARAHTFWKRELIGWWSCSWRS
jgi:hypothetical protein